MLSLLLITFLFGQVARPGDVAALQAQQTGTVSGVLRDHDGKPMEGIRVAAVPLPDAAVDSLANAAMSSLAQTDADGRYTLENIPPGRYYIAAGRVDRQTYFPGTPDVAMAREMVIASGQRVPNIDFALNEVSVSRDFRPEDRAIPLVVNVEDGGPLPLSGGGRATVFGFMGLDGRPSIFPPLSLGFTILAAAQPGHFRVVADNLPARYAVKSIMYGSNDVLTHPLEFVSVDPTVRPGMPLSLVPRVIAESRAAGRAIPYTPLTVTLNRVTPPAKAGVRVSGRLTTAPHERQTVYLSNIPGDLYADGTFEFFGVPPGRHSIITGNNPTHAYPSGASVVVRDQDVENVVLEETSLTPHGSFATWLPLPIGNRSAGNVHLPRITGTIVDASGQAVRDGAVVIKSPLFYIEAFPLNAQGRFEIPALLPGSYELEVQAFGHDNARRSVELDDQDVSVEFVVRRFRSGL